MTNFYDRYNSQGGSHTDTERTPNEKGIINETKVRKKETNQNMCESYISKFSFSLLMIDDSLDN